MKISVSDYEDYLYDHYEEHGIDTSLFMKLVEEVGEVAEVLNKRDGRKASDNEDLKSQLANELVDVIHYAFAIASLNEIDLNDVILEKDKKASIKYNHAAAAVSVIGTNPPLLNPARNIRHTGEITQRNVASASFGAVSRLSARYRDASSMLTRRSAGVLSAAAGSSAGSSISSLSR